MPIAGIQATGRQCRHARERRVLEREGRAAKPAGANHRDWQISDARPD